MMVCSFHLVANLIAESSEVAVNIIQRTNLIEAMYQASQNQVCSNKMLGTLVWLASSLLRENN